MNLFFDALYDRFHELHADIERLLESLPEEALDWKPGPDMNTVSVLITHLTGAERFLIGDVVMGEPSNRSREAEFQAAGLAKRDLFERLHGVDAYVRAALAKMSLADLDTERLHPRHGNKVSVAFAILHALEHAATHVGHLDLTVQLWQQKNG